MGASEIEAFLTHLVLDEHVVASTQNQVLSVLLFLYREVLEKPIEEPINAVRARKPVIFGCVLQDGYRTVLHVEPPIEPLSIEHVVRTWAGQLEQFVLHRPEHWNFVLDRKWRRMIREGRRQFSAREHRRQNS